MNYIKQYIDYVKDNPEGYWFKRKIYGWGWTPVTKEGWIVILSFIIILLLNGFYFASKVEVGGEPTTKDLLIFFGVLIVSIVAIFWICYKKSEKPGWQWGLK